MTNTTTTETIRIDPSDPLAGLWGTTTGASAEEMEELTSMVNERGARVVAVELLSAAASATGWTWGDETLAALTRALAGLVEEHRVTVDAGILAAACRRRTAEWVAGMKTEMAD